MAMLLDRGSTPLASTKQIGIFPINKTRQYLSLLGVGGLFVFSAKNTV
nr:hypothetical protein [uncultured Anaeromusa sp.]